MPTCQDSCQNSWCSAPDECTCYPGYEPDEAKPFKCKPKCALQCIQGSCTAPDVCDCHPGWKKNSLVQNKFIIEVDLQDMNLKRDPQTNVCQYAIFVKVVTVQDQVTVHVGLITKGRKLDKVS